MFQARIPKDCEIFLNLGRRKSQAPYGPSVEAWRSPKYNPPPRAGIPQLYLVIWSFGHLVIWSSGHLVIGLDI
jgi:hypothetical protein